jgi:hypothetical protein
MMWRLIRGHIMDDQQPRAPNRASLRIEKCLESANNAKAPGATCGGAIDFKIVRLTKIEQAFSAAVKKYDPTHRSEQEPDYAAAASVDYHSVGGVDVTVSPTGSGINIRATPWADVNQDPTAVNTLLCFSRSKDRGLEAVLVSESLNGDYASPIAVPAAIAQEVERQLKLAEERVQEKQAPGNRLNPKRGSSPPHHP